MTEAELRLRANRPKTHRGVRQLKARIGKAHEDVRKQIVFRGNKTSPTVMSALQDLHRLKGSYSIKHINQRLDKPIFDDLSSVTSLSERNDCTLFAYGSSTKKRRHNLVLGRLFDFHLMDMFEFGINAKTYLSMDSFLGIDDPKSTEPGNKSYGSGSKPAIIFQGGGFQNDPLLRKLKPFLIDYFKGEDLPRYNLFTLDHVLVFSVVTLDEMTPEQREEIGFAEIGQLIMLRHYKVEWQPSRGGKLPFVHLKEIGPAMDLHLRRHEFGNDEIMRKAMERPERQLLSNKPKGKNITKGRFRGERVGRLHIDIRDQNVEKMNLKKMKPLRDRRRGGINKKYGNDKRSRRRVSNRKRAWKASGGAKRAGEVEE